MRNDTIQGEEVGTGLGLVEFEVDLGFSRGDVQGGRKYPRSGSLEAEPEAGALG